MTIQTLLDKQLFHVLSLGDSTRSIAQVFSCDLLSIVMSKCPSNAAWITVMGNLNAIAVASLTDASCIILAENSTMDETCLKKAQEENITVFQTHLPIFDAGLLIQGLLSYE